MRTIMIAMVVAAAGTLPALAQDRTPPAGSLRALQAPIDQPVQLAPYSFGYPDGLATGRSVEEQPVLPRRGIDVDR